MLHCGQVLQGRYQLKQNLGENASRQTWLATDLEVSDAENSQVIVKLLTFGGQFQWENLKLFEREAQVLKQLNHSQIPTYRDYFCIDDRLLYFCLVQKYISGSSLKELLNQGKKFSQQQVHKIVVDVLNILIYLHELSPPVLHRDIKPSNLILGEDEQIYLIDFGAVQDKAATEGATFTIVGTYGYTPMEQFGGRAVPASDLYALGATLIHLLTGTAPGDLPQRDLRIQFSDRVSLSPRFTNWLENLTEPAPERRFNTARQALEALETRFILSSQINNQTNFLPTLHYPDAQNCPLSDTRIELNKSPEQLQIKIPLRRILDIPLAICLAGAVYLFILMWLANSPETIFLLVALIPGIITGLISGIIIGIDNFFVTTQVSFNRNKFEMKKKLFNLTYLWYTGVTQQIEDVSIKYDAGGRTNPIGVTIISSPYPDYFIKIKQSFGRGLTDTELIWLAQEIQDWLQAQKLAEPKH